MNKNENIENVVAETSNKRFFIGIILTEFG